MTVLGPSCPMPFSLPEHDPNPPCSDRNLDKTSGPEHFRTMQIAFQPIVDLKRQTVYAYEALVRGAQGQGAPEVLAAVPSAYRAEFEHRTMLMALFCAAKLKLQTRLALNLSPSVFANPGTLLSLRTAAATAGIVPRRLILELSESEPQDQEGLTESLRTCRALGLATAIDDFGAGYAGLSLLVSHQPQLLKIDMHLVQGIAHDAVRQALVEGIVLIAEKLGCELVAEGVETPADARQLLELGIGLQQGYLYARPAPGALPPPDLSWSWKSGAVASPMIA